MNDNPLYNELLPPDVNASGTVTVDDANAIAIFLGANGIQPIDGLTNPGDFYADVDNDRMITPQDYLAVVAYLQGGGGGESSPPTLAMQRTRPGDVGYYTNFLVRRDTNLDGIVAPNDALIIANHLNTFGPQTSLNVQFNRQFVDPNGDEYVAPSDFLYIANYLIEQAAIAMGEGEASAGVRAGNVEPLVTRVVGSLSETAIRSAGASAPSRLSGSTAAALDAWAGNVLLTSWAAAAVAAGPQPWNADDSLPDSGGPDAEDPESLEWAIDEIARDVRGR